MPRPRAIDPGVAIGDIFVDKYRVDAILGHGSMGVVALCTHLALAEQVAIKMLRKDVLHDADAIARFMREAQSACRLRSEYVARVTDVGRSASNVPYMVMEYLEGHDLGQLLAERGHIGVPWAIELTLQACDALAEAHSLGIVHRDIKPTNLFVTWRPDGSALIKLLDFGISKALMPAGMELTQTQSLLGTPAYMSPEQMRSARQVDPRSDIWALGAVLYELLEGRRPFEAEGFSEMCFKVAVEPPAAMTKAPPGLERVVLRCLAKPPDQRYASMAELAAALVPFAQDHHHAQVLAARMARTLRRSQVIDWEVAQLVGNGVRHAVASGSDPALPELHARDVADAADAADVPDGVVAATGSEPALRVHPAHYPTVCDPLLTTRTGKRAPIREPSDTVEIPRHHRRNMVIIAAVTAIATLAIIVALIPPSARGPAAPPMAPLVVTPPVVTPPVPAAPAPPIAPSSEPVLDPTVDPGDEPPAAAPARRPPPTTARPSATPPVRPRIRVPDAATRDSRPRKPPPPCDVFADPHAKNCQDHRSGSRKN